MKAQLLAVEDFCRTGSGTTPSRSKAEAYYGGIIPWVKSGELREGIIARTEETVTELALKETALKLAPAGAILIAMYGANVGRLGLLAMDATTNQAVCHLVPDPRVSDTRFLFHALLHLQPSLVQKGVGGAQPNISQEIIRKTKLWLPPLAEQRRIAAILDQADALRRKRREALAILQRLKFIIFDQMFLASAAFPTGKIGDLTATTQYGTSAKAGETGTLPILRMGNITYEGDLDLGDLKFIDLGEGEIDKYTVVDGDILFNRTNSPDLVGKTAVYRGGRMAFAGYLVRLRTNDRADPEYISAYLNSKRGKTILRGMCKAIIGMANINAKEMQGISIPLPPVELQHAFAARVAEIDKLKNALRAHLKQLDILFDTLQHRAFRGELTDVVQPAKEFA